MHARRLGALAGAVALLLGAAACGDDDEASSDTTEAADETTTTEADETTTTGEGGDGEDEGPDVNPCAPGVDASELLPPATPPAEGATELAVTGVEYAFQGLDAISAPGEYALTFTNGGEELHEIVLVKLADETTPLEELLASDTEPEMEEVAFTFACPGENAETTAVSIDGPGRYVAVCFIPVGTTPETLPEEIESLGPPHAFQGMAQELRIGI